MLRLAVFVLAASAAAAFALPVGAQPAPQLKDLKLVAEKSTSFEELGAGNKNGNFNGRGGRRFGYYAWVEFDYSGTIGYFGARRERTETSGEIGDIDFVDDSELGKPAAR